MSPFTIEHSGVGSQLRLNGDCLCRWVLQLGEDPVAAPQRLGLTPLNWQPAFVAGALASRASIRELDES